MRIFSDCQFDFAQFGKYLQNMHRDLLAIKKYYCNYFDANSKVDIDTYIKNFDSYVELVKIVLYDKEKYKNWKSTIQDYDNSDDKYAILLSLFKKNVATLDFSPSDSDIYLSPNTVVFFNNDVFKILEQIANSIFQLEDDVSKITIPIWNKTLTSVNDFDGKKPYRLLVKVLNEWRVLFSKGEEFAQTCDYLNNRIGCSLSYVTDYKSLFFKSRNGAYGIVYSLNDGFIAGSSKDAYLDEFINDECPQDIPTLSMNPIRQVYFENGNSVQANATKIATPKGVLFKNSDRYNEIIADKRKITPVAVFYLKYDKTTPNKQDFKLFDKCKDSADALAKTLNVPIIELNQFEKVYNTQQKMNDEVAECAGGLTL